MVDVGVGGTTLIYTACTQAPLNRLREEAGERRTEGVETEEEEEVKNTV